jgi:hypothetical protein
MAEPKAARRGKLSWRLWLLTAGFESAMIVLSLLLGLWLTGWAQDQDEKRRVDDLRGYILQEIRSNRALILSDEIIGHHRRLKRIVGPLARPDVTMAEARPAFDAVTNTGVHLPQVDDSVWRSVSSGDLLEHMPPDDVFALTRVYRTHDDLTLIKNTLYQTLTRAPGELMRGDPPAGPVMQLNLSLADLVAVEEELLGRYEKVLTKMDPAFDPKAAPAKASPPPT